MIDARLMEEIVRRVVEVARPEKVILFGSAAGVNASSANDVDLLVIKAGAHRRAVAKAIYRKVAGVGCPVDVVVVTPEDVKRYGHSPALVIEPALRTGRVVYAA